MHRLAVDQHGAGAAVAGIATLLDAETATIAQLVEARGVNSFYHNNAIKTWAIAADGEVSNVYA